MQWILVNAAVTIVWAATSFFNIKQDKVRAWKTLGYTEKAKTTVYDCKVLHYLTSPTQFDKVRNPTKCLNQI